MKAKVCLVACFLLMAPWASAEIYTWKDSAGRIHYGDNPSEVIQAEAVNVEVNGYAPVEYQAFEATVTERPKKVVMYATSWCGYCKKARDYFNKHGIAFQEYDVETDAKAKRKYEQINGKGVPVIFVGDKRMNGFSEQRFKKMYQSKS